MFVLRDHAEEAAPSPSASMLSGLLSDPALNAVERALCRGVSVRTKISTVKVQHGGGRAWCGSGFPEGFSWLIT